MKCTTCGHVNDASAMSCDSCGSSMILDERWPNRHHSELGFIQSALKKEFTILREIGRGGMAVVYEAIDQVLQRHVALKVLLPEFTHDREVVERFRREAIVASRLDHPSIVQIFKIGQADRTWFISMKLVEGETLKEKLARGKRLRMEEVLDLLGPIADALDYAHRRGIVHRDIKSSNVLISGENSWPFLTDFGIAKARDAMMMTATGEVFGTPEYMSPEQAAGKECTPRSDLYSFGIVLYEMLVGHPPFMGNSPVATALMHINEEVRVPPELPERGRRVLLRSLSKDPALRYGSSVEMMQELGGLTQSSRFGTGRMTVPSAKRKSTIQFSLAPGSKMLMVPIVLLAVFLVIMVVSEVQRGSLPAPTQGPLVTDRSSASNVRETSGSNAIQINQDAIINHLNNIAAIAYQHRIRPNSMGGGNGRYDGSAGGISFELPPKFTSTEHATYRATVYSDRVMVIAVSRQDERNSISVIIDSNGQLGNWRYNGAFRAAGISRDVASGGQAERQSEAPRSATPEKTRRDPPVVSSRGTNIRLDISGELGDGWQAFVLPAMDPEHGRVELRRGGNQVTLLTLGGRDIDELGFSVTEYLRRRGLTTSQSFPMQLQFERRGDFVLIAVNARGRSQIGLRRISISDDGSVAGTDGMDYINGNRVFSVQFSRSDF